MATDLTGVDLAACLEHLGLQCRMTDDYKNVKFAWEDKTHTCPTEDDFATAWTAVQVKQKRAQRLAEIQKELCSLDMYISRGLEDTWSLLGTDTTKLPAEQQTRLARKVMLRTAYNSIEAAATLDEINAVTY